MTIQDQNTRAWPGSTSASTLAFYCRRRQTEGSGAYVVIPGVADFTFVFTGRDQAVTLSVIRESVIAALTGNEALTSWWSPENSTIEAALRAALSSWITGSNGGAVACTLLFDGQFGPVLAA